MKVLKELGFQKTILDQYNIKDMVELILEKDQIIIKPTTEPRRDWEHAFAQMHENGDDQLLMDDVFNDESLKE